MKKLGTVKIGMSIAGACGHAINGGDPVYGYRERALSHHEAAHAGTLYPMRRICAPCAQARMAARKPVTPAEPR